MVPIVQPKRRGRPRKYAEGTTRQSRRRLKAQAEEELLIPTALVATTAPAAQDLASYIRPLGDSSAQLVAKVLRSSDTALAPEVEHVIGK